MHAKVETETIKGLRVDRLYSPDGAPKLGNEHYFSGSESVLATGNGAQQGARVIPLHLVYEARPTVQQKPPSSEDLRPLPATRG